MTKIFGGFAPQVSRRIGGLEMLFLLITLHFCVSRRIGGLEMKGTPRRVLLYVSRRIGGLEIKTIL